MYNLLHNVTIYFISRMMISCLNLYTPRHPCYNVVEEDDIGVDKISLIQIDANYYHTIIITSIKIIMLIKYDCSPCLIYFHINHPRSRVDETL